MSRATLAGIFLAAVVAAAFSACAGYALLTEDDVEAAESRSCAAAIAEAPAGLAGEQSPARPRDEPADAGIRCD